MPGKAAKKIGFPLWAASVHAAMQRVAYACESHDVMHWAITTSPEILTQMGDQ